MLRLLTLLVLLGASTPPAPAQADPPDDDPSRYLQALASKDPAVRRRAARAMAKSSARVVAEMQRLHREKGDQYRETERWNILAERLTRLTRDGRRTIAEALWDDETDVVEAITEVIGGLGSWGAEWVPDLVAAWEQEAILVRRGIIWAIAGTGRTTLEARRCIAQALRSKDTIQMTNALVAIYPLGADGLAFLPSALTLVKHADVGLAERSCAVVEKIVADLRRRLTDLQDESRRRGHPANPDGERILTRHIDDAWERAEKPLLDVLAKRRPKIAAWAACALGSFGPRAASTVPNLLAAWERRDPHLQRNVVRALAMIEKLPDSVIPCLLLALCRKDDLDIRQNALWAVQHLGVRAKKLLPLVREQLLEQRRGEIPVNAAHALREMGPAAVAAIPDLWEWRERGGDAELVERAFRNMGAAGRFALSRSNRRDGEEGAATRTAGPGTIPFPVSELAWEGVFAEREGVENSGYSLVNVAWLRAGAELDVTDAVEAWVDAHEGARAIPISALERKDADGERVRLVHVWGVAKGGANLVISLVEKGLLELDMLDTVAADSLLVPAPRYIAFLAAAESAEARAIAAEAGIHGTPQRKQARLHQRAQALMDAHEWEDAAAALKALIALHPRAASLQLSRARCLEELGRDKEALTHYDAALADHGDVNRGPWGSSRLTFGEPLGTPPNLDLPLARARCTERLFGRDAAEKWLLEKAGEGETDPRGPWLLGFSRWRRGQLASAAKPFEDALARAQKRDGIKFDDDTDRLVLDEATRAKEIYEFFDTWAALHHAAIACEAAGRPDDAWLHATRLIGLIRHCARAGHRDQSAPFLPRLVRARIAIGRGHWDIADTELEHARNASKHTDRETWRQWSAAFEKAARDLRNRRP
ncbi:MAG: hypothetical protein CMJ83_09735 [Planctomycetes bacterium]|nr:hypothetical protein [Planctomycetota bacterium]